MFADRNEVLGSFKENLIFYLNNLQQEDTSWNDEEYEYSMQGRDNLEVKLERDAKIEVIPERKKQRKVKGISTKFDDKN